MGPITFIKEYFKKNPLLSIMVLALLFRALASIFSQGYGMHDDHFLVIEAPFSWSEGKDYNYWFPWNQDENAIPSGHSLFYPGINFLLFMGMKSAGISDPKIMMFIIRLLLGLFSLATVFYGYKIVEKLAGQKSAISAGFLLALLWFMPFFSVRNLVEIITVPFYTYGFWLILKSEDNPKPLQLLFLAGLITGIGISIRFQSAILVGSIGLALLFRKKFIQAILYGFGALTAFVLIQGITDYFIWGRPFAEFIEYFRYNLANKDAYGTDNMLMYVELILGLLIPPISIFLFIGFFKVWKKHLVIFLPVFLFIAFHTVFSNRQERFILPVLPFIPVLGVIGWNDITEKSKFWEKHQKFLKGCWKFFWIINVILLIPVSISSTKKSRIDAMYYFFDKRDQISTILIEDTGRKRNSMLPVFYAGKAINTVSLIDDDPNDTINYNTGLNMASYIFDAHSMKIFNDTNGLDRPQYIIFVEDTDMQNRIEHMLTYFPNLHHAYNVPPSTLDKVMKTLNPVNKNETYYIIKQNKSPKLEARCQIFIYFRLLTSSFYLL